jgi:hypothetical protein
MRSVAILSRIGIMLLLVAVFALGWLLKTEIEENRQHASEIQRLNAQSVDRGSRDALDLQEKCAAQADRVYGQWEQANKQSPFRAPGDDSILSYQSHYNVALKKCFMTIHSFNTSAKSQSSFSKI